MRRLAALALLIAACAKPPPTGSLPAPDYAIFKQQVETELMGSCGFSNCHGDPQRPMRLYALAGNRIRTGLPARALSEEEHRANYDRVRTYAAATSAELPDLLRKPLQKEAGGSGHTAVDRFGANVYAAKTDPGWRLLDDWVHGRLTYDDGGTVVPDAGMPMPDAGPGPTCVEQLPFGYAATVGMIVNTTTCTEAACHSPENIASGDAGCFDPTSCQTVKASGCGGTRSVVPCDRFASKLYQYTGVAPFYKGHQGKLSAGHAKAIGAWIDAGLPCD